MFENAREKIKLSGITAWGFHYLRVSLLEGFTTWGVSLLEGFTTCFQLQFQLIISVFIYYIFLITIWCISELIISQIQALTGKEDIFGCTTYGTGKEWWPIFDWKGKQKTWWYLWEIIIWPAEFYAISKLYIVVQLLTFVLMTQYCNLIKI